MNKKVAVINDLSGFGRCSLTAAISVLSAMGVSPCPFPTAVLTNQTGYDSYYCDDYTDKVHHYTEEWSKLDAHFDGIYTGFMMGEKQIEQIERFLDRFQKPDTCLLVDPVMGDNGAAYGIYTQKLRDSMRRLAERADIITPNFTELCLLSGEDCTMAGQMEEMNQRVEKIREMGIKLCNKENKVVLVTGVIYDDQDGEQCMGNVYVTRRDCRMIAQPYLEGSYSGTGDLLASTVIGGVVRGDSVTDTVELAGRFLQKALRDTITEKIPRNDGVNYEQFLGMLIK